MKGTAVRQIQEACAALYFYPEKGAKNNGIDGYYGKKTADAVRRFQLMHGLSPDGIYGPKTRAKLDDLLN
ncbi:peptidoglycan-binding protein [Bacillus swezeyi]|uniref:Peptidoglycan-binding protein n=1 Tax=Bacillus swezeyi TaxID=1925020 RepID=A0A5M8RTY8_9BACI|nr:peptidoglycan-binding protein [Bacillus swezeyi]